MISSETGYYIKPVVYNPVNENKYVFMGGFDGEITFGLNRWILNFNIYLDHNIFLPSNVLMMNVHTSIGTVENITLNKTNKTILPEYVKNKEEASHYTCQCILNVDNSEYLKQKLTHHFIPIDLTFKTNSESLSHIDIKESEALNQFVSEFESMRDNSGFYFTNYTERNDSGEFNIDQKYYFVNQEVVDKESTPFEFITSNQLDLIDEPIDNLLTIRSEQPFSIVGYEINFNYSINNNPIKTLKHKFNNSFYCDKIHTFIYPYETAFDENKQEIVDLVGDNKGFYSPIITTGYYEIKATILLDTTYMNIKITKDFSFSGKTIDNLFKINPFWINDLTNFKELRI